MNIINVEQGTQEWLDARAGKVTASKIHCIMAEVKKGESAERRNYRAQLVAEILTGKSQEDGYTSGPMQWGIEQEPFARVEYEILKGVMVDRVGLVIHPAIERGAASPDGLVGPDGLVEIKCPNTATHLDYLTSEDIPLKYIQQMQWQMACTGRQWCDFVSFDPRLPEDYRLWIVRYSRRPAIIQEIETKVQAFLGEVDQTIENLRAKKTA